ncbi:MAG: ABC transporter permease [Acidobacteriota bacterium]|nr:ABC transporter permease [Acidobacteriota bacterium]
MIVGEMWRRLIFLFRNAQFHRELEEEMEHHVAMKAEARRRQGLSPEEARRAARREFGNSLLLRERSSDEWGWAAIESFMQDLRHGFRMLRKAPGFTAVAILTFALGIGANTAMFSMIDAVLLHPLPYPQASQLVLAYTANQQAGIAESPLTYPDFTEIRDENRVFSAVASMGIHNLTLTGRGEPSIVSTVVVTPQFFSVLGVQPLLGRAFLPADGPRGAAPVAILSENLWRSRFGADPKIVGSSVDLDMRAFTIVGVMPAGLRSPFVPASEQVWIPLVQDPLFSSWMTVPGRHWMVTLARLKPGVTRTQAEAQMEALAARLAQKFPAQNAGWTAGIRPLESEVIGPDVRKALLVLLGAVGLLLLVACANIASLLLARATVRTREMAVRTALGAPRARLARQLLTESALLGLLGALAGIALAFACVHGMHSLLPPDMPSLRPIRVNGEVLAFALALSLAASVLFGFAPALSAVSGNLHAGLMESPGRSTTAGPRLRVRSALAAVEIAVAMVLLVGAGLLIRSFVALTSVSPGFDARQAWQAEISLPRYEYSTPDQWVAFSNQFLSRLQAEPGTKDAAFGVPLPFFVQGDVVLGVRIVGNPPSQHGAGPMAHYVSISPDYFRVMSIPLFAGRFFREEDSSAAPRVAIISRAFTHRYFPRENPLGRQLVFGFPPNTQVSRRIVGVVGDVRDVSLGRAPAPMMYVPFAQEPFWGGTLVLKSPLSASSVNAAIRQAAASIDPNLPVTNFQPLQSAVGASVAQPRLRALLLGLFGALALILAAAGIFGVLSYSVSQRTNEIGIRLALGASPGSIRKMALAEGAKVGAVGLGAGALAALALARLLQNELYSVTVRDPATFVGAGVLLGAVALAACYVPARRAMRVDPAIALRHE